MRFPPEEYPFQHWDHYGTYMPPEPAAGLGGALLIHVDEAAHISGPFRLALAGQEMLVAEFPAKECLALGGSADFMLRMEVMPRDIIIRENMITSDWFDLEDR
jgi:hypothetical protein